MRNQAEAGLSALIESTEDLIWSVDLEYRLIAFNSALRQNIEDTLGVRLAAGMRLHDLLPPDRAAHWPLFFERVLSQGAFRVEYPLILPRILELAFSLIVIDGETTGISVFGKDITERQAAEHALKEAEKKYRNIFDGALEGMFQKSSEGKSLTANRALAEMLGYDSPDDLQSAVTDVIQNAWVDREDHSRFMRQIEEHGAVRGFECQLRRKDGTILWVSLNCRRVCGNNAQPLYHEGFVTDITERKRTEKELRESGDFLRETQEFGDLGCYVLDVSTGVWTSSAGLDELLGIGKDYDRTVAGWLALMHPDDRARMAAHASNELVGQGTAFNTEYRIIRQTDRAERWVEGTGRLEFDAQGKPLRMRGIIQDVTERKRTENQLRDSEESLRESQNIAGLGSYVLDIRTGYWKGTAVLDAVFGIDKTYERNVEGWAALIHPDDRASMSAYFAEQVVAKCQEFNREYRIVRATDRAVRWVHGIGRLEFDAQGLPARMRGTIQDITGRKRAEMQLRESEERFRSTFEQAAVGIVHTSLEGRFLRCNSRFAEIVGYSLEELPGMTFQQITAPEDLWESESVRRQMTGAATQSASWEKRYQRKDGRLTWVKATVSVHCDADGSDLYYIALIEDINARKIAEQRLAAAQEALQTSETRYRTVFQTSLDPITISRADSELYIDANQEFLDVMGFERDEVIGRTSLDLNLWTDPRDRENMVAALSRGAEYRNVEILFRKKSGEPIWGMMSASLIEIDGVLCVITVARDISAAKASEQRLATAQQALRASEERYRTVFQTSLDFISINRLSDGMYVDVNKAFFDTMGFEPEEVFGHTSLELNVWVDSRDRRNFVELLGLQSQCRNLEASFRRKSGEVFSALVSAAVIELEGVPCIVTQVRDISHAKAAEDEIRNLAFYDPLTGLPNRRLLVERLHQALAASNRSGRMRALLFVDLDNFKTLNETLGHQTGDLLLKETARRISACAGDADTVSRLGGDEFVLMLEDLSELPEDAAAHAKSVGEKILAAVGQPYLLEAHECRSSASIGVSVFGDRRETINEVMQQADIAMYQAKAAGRNTVRFFAPALQAAVNARATMEDDLRKAIKNDEFVLYYQPQVDRARVTGAEALIRWKHPTRGILAPGEFIPLAEETGLILPLGNWALESACAQIAAWARRRQSAHIAVAVNISTLQLRQPDFVQSVLAALDRTGANPKNLDLELTESMLVVNVEEVIAKITELKSHGLRFSLDDFGTGYSSLAYLKRLPLDQLKIDRSFVRDILADDSSGAIAQTIISLSRAMGLSVIAEGVETEEQRLLLARLGCHAYQGFLFSRPLPVHEFERLCLPSVKSAVAIAG